MIRALNLFWMEEVEEKSKVKNEEKFQITQSIRGKEIELNSYPRRKIKIQINAAIE